MSLSFRGAQTLRTAAPRAATDYFVIALWRSCRVLRRAVLVIVSVIPIADPLPDIPGHVIDAIWTLARFKHPYWRQCPMIAPFLFLHVRVKPRRKLISPG